jgi:hypothetical protein
MEELDYREGLIYKLQSDLDEDLDQIDSHELALPNRHEEVTKRIIAEFLSKCDLAQDDITRVSKKIRSDLTYLRNLARDEKSRHKSKLNLLIAQDTREKVSGRLKEATAEAALVKESALIAKLLGLSDILETSLEYVNNKRADFKQKNRDIKELYKMHKEEEAMAPPSTKYSAAQNPFKEPVTSSEPKGTDIDAQLNELLSEAT